MSASPEPRAVPAAFTAEEVELRGELLLAGTGAAPAKGSVVLVHGFNSSRGEFGPLPRQLAQAGYHTLSFDLRGYGASHGEARRTDDRLAVADIDAAARWLHAQVGPMPMGVVGHSLGGAYALAAMARTAHFTAGVVAHPVDRLFDELAWYEQAGYHLLGKRAEARMAKGKPPGTIQYKLGYESLFVSPEAASAARTDGFLLGRVSLGNYRFALTMSGRTWARAVHQPVLAIGSEHDKALRPGHSRAVYEALDGPKAWLDHSGGHSCWRDVDSAKVCAAAVAWFDQHLAGGGK